MKFKNRICIFFVLFIFLVIVFLINSSTKLNYISDLINLEKKDFVQKNNIKSNFYLQFDNRIIDQDGLYLFNFTKNVSFPVLFSNKTYIAVIKNISEKYNIYHNRIGYFYKNGTPIWIKEMPAHHHIEKTKSDTFLVPVKYERLYMNRTVSFDKIIEFDIDGNIIWEWDGFEHLNELFKFLDKKYLDYLPSDINHLNDDHSPYQVIFYPQTNETYYNYFHLNYVHEINNINENVKILFLKEGNLLVSLAALDVIVIIDKETGKILWHFGPNELDGQHSPIVLKNGTVCVFDNGFVKKNFDYKSRVLFINPLSNKIYNEISYVDNHFLNSEKHGYVDVFDDNLFLISNSFMNEAFIVDDSSNVFWSWKDEDDYRNESFIYYRMRSINNGIVESFLN
jgi:hypothetical protein